MQPYYELAYALASGSLSFFVGTGFSKHLTAGRAPDWQSLLIRCCASLKDPDTILEELFPGNKPILPLEECASVIALQMRKEGKSLYETIAKDIRKLKADDDAVKPLRDFSAKHKSLKFITTNYDRLIEDEILDGNYSAFCPGFPINRQREYHEVYHIHGAVGLPDEMVVTADDYYRFINVPNYFSKRLDTLIQENTTIIIGYSLGDINFKSILNAHRQHGSHIINRQHLFFLTRKSVPQYVKDYYDSSYGLRVIENTEIPDLILKIDKRFDDINLGVKDAKKTLRSVLNGDMKYTDAFLKKEESFAKILATISSTGFRIQHQNLIALITDTIKRKHDFTNQIGAWEQYTHLAAWLVQIGCVMDLKDTPLANVYLQAVKTSFCKMSKTKEYGKSWDAYKIWSSHWGDVTFKNRILIRDFIKKEGIAGDHSTFIHM
jgi:hypothetical protein